ncbi:MAG: amidohydrolase family protein [Pirellulaceae bacterium]|nr:amidohydrolase [Planctomycetales bacterium]
MLSYQSGQFLQLSNAPRDGDSNILTNAIQCSCSCFVLFVALPLLAAEPDVTTPDSPTTVLDGQNGRPLALDRFRPHSTLIVPESDCSQAKFPVVDVHTHFGFRLHGSHEQLDQYVATMERHNITVSVNMDAKLGDSWLSDAEFVWRDHRERFVQFVFLDMQGTGKDDDPSTWDCHRPDFARRMARHLTDAKRNGASGLKIFKQFGLGYRNPDDSLIAIDDPRWDPIWHACGELGLPVLIHTADPAAFFLPIDANNERWEELRRHPDWSFYGEKFPPRDQLLAARNRVIARHPRTLFIGAHVASSAEDLQQVSQWLATYPNLYVDIASRIGELGRQPYSARKFFLEHADRVLFGTDGPFPEARLRSYWRFLETYDEYFPYSEKEFPPQGFWNIYGLSLPDDVLHKIYHENAARIIPGVRERLENR